MGLVAIAVVLSTMHYEADVPTSGGDYVDVPFVVPAGTVEIEIAHTDGSDSVILDWGVWAADGSFRGWGGGNTENAIIGIDQSSRSYLPGPIAAGTWTVSIGKALLDAAGGHYAIDVTCRDNATLTVETRAAFTPVTLSPDRRWYKGDFHVHSIQSGDANASFADIATLAKSRGLDFVNLSDHNTYSQHALIAAAQPAYPDFLFLRGTEITTYSGHGNSVGTHDYIEHRLGYNGRTVQGIVDDVVAEGGIFIVNHPMLDLGTQCIGCAWKHVDDTPWDKVSGIEIITGPFDIGIQAFVPRVLTLWDQLLDQGYRIAAIGGSDDHRAGTDTGPTASKIGSPTTLVHAENLSEAAIIKAVREGRTVVQLRGSDDPIVDLKLRVSSESGGVEAEIGDEVTGYNDVVVDVHVTGGDGTIAQLWRDGQKLTQTPVSGADATVSLRDDAAPDGLHRYRVELINDLNQRIVITSHIYLHTTQAPSDGCGCATGDASGGLMIGAGLLVLRRRRRRS